MKKVLTTLVLSLSALVATSAMAAPYHYDSPYHSQPSKPAPHWNSKDHRKWQDDRRHHNRMVNPSRDWRVGQTLPRQYDSKRFQISDREARRLPNTGRYQQWYKVNNDYVLVNERNNKIVRIIG
ncbi:hypothetical protein E2K73_13900 [Acinetobacter sp. RF15A]|uniref:RcnB family protein n=1 Tax=unclassified Acinetobacter TaxID=196816 RepID=UPI001191E4C6|nr:MULTISPECIES: RcnB family protein [unclassified Acinetobacter]TSH68315.1 hypothetical protein E2K73_13900 [Acinetobacter sp. RF15A]TSI14067.1 hypothetical protein E2K74_13855 [Acinetobacter sp. RF15B]